MQRTTWTDERLDDFSQRMDAGFERVDRDIRDLRGEMQAGFIDVRREFADVRGEINSLRSLMFRLNVGLIVSLVAAVLLRGI